MPKIAVDAAAYFTVKAFAQRAGALAAFHKGYGQLLETMSGFCVNTETPVVKTRGEVWLDSPHSFSWALYRTGPNGVEKLFYGGGLVHSAPTTTAAAARRISPAT